MNSYRTELHRRLSKPYGWYNDTDTIVQWQWCCSNRKTNTTGSIVKQRSDLSWYKNKNNACKISLASFGGDGVPLTQYGSSASGCVSYGRLIGFTGIRRWHCDTLGNKMAALTLWCGLWGLTCRSTPGMYRMVRYVPYIVLRNKHVAPGIYRGSWPWYKPKIWNCFVPLHSRL